MECVVRTTLKTDDELLRWTGCAEGVREAQLGRGKLEERWRRR